ncbi:tyrosine-type recombinase/integrase [Brevundimonas sp. DC300-4]|uniref:tyrosine-type recombinase/integrase n=1 Tax=Brevundimonas sp. DC300-4 TaxID=2804594 RepID=UPI003CF76429
MSRFGPYTQHRTRKDGSYVFFQHFHANLRPKGFPAGFQIHEQDEPGPLTNEERELILERAMVNYDEFCEARKVANPMTPPREGPLPENSWKLLADLAKDSFWFDGLSVHSKRLYALQYDKIVAAFDGKPELDPTVISQSQIEQWLRRRGYSSHVVITWGVIFNQLLRIAANEGIRPNHRPIRMQVRRAPPGPIRIWEQSDVDAVIKAFEDKGDMITSELVQTAWATGQRLGDIRQLRYDKNYQDGCLHFLTNKTAARIMLTLPDALRQRLDQRYRPGQLMFPSPRGRTFTISHLSEYFRGSTKHLAGYDDLPLKLRTLRHSAILNFARAGCTIPMIASVTGHSLVTVHKILGHYLPRDPILAAQAQAMRAEADNVFALNPVIEGYARTLIDGRALPQKPTAGPQRRSA